MTLSVEKSDWLLVVNSCFEIISLFFNSGPESSFIEFSKNDPGLGFTILSSFGGPNTEEIGFSRELSCFLVFPVVKSDWLFVVASGFWIASLFIEWGPEKNLNEFSDNGAGKNPNLAISGLIFLVGSSEGYLGIIADIGISRGFSCLLKIWLENNDWLLVGNSFGFNASLLFSWDSGISFDELIDINSFFWVLSAEKKLDPENNPGFVVSKFIFFDGSKSGLLIGVGAFSGLFNFSNKGFWLKSKGFKAFCAGACVSKELLVLNGLGFNNDSCELLPKGKELEENGWNPLNELDVIGFEALLERPPKIVWLNFGKFLSSASLFALRAFSGELLGTWNILPESKFLSLSNDFEIIICVSSKVLALSSLIFNWNLSFLRVFSLFSNSFLLRLSNILFFSISEAFVFIFAILVLK